MIVAVEIVQWDDSMNDGQQYKAQNQEAEEEEGLPHSKQHREGSGQHKREKPISWIHLLYTYNTSFIIDYEEDRNETIV